MYFFYSKVVLNRKNNSDLSMLLVLIYIFLRHNLSTRSNNFDNEMCL